MLSFAKPSDDSLFDFASVSKKTAMEMITLMNYAHMTVCHFKPNPPHSFIKIYSGSDALSFLILS